MPRKNTKSKPTPVHPWRGSWKGNLSFGLVSFAVQALNVVDTHQAKIEFHQLHKDCHRRIRYQKVCPVHGEISQDEIVSGYEYEKGHYIEIDPDELEALRQKRERSLTIDTFIRPTDIDPLFLDGRMYYLLPDGEAAMESYAVVREALEKEKRYGFGRFVLTNKEQPAIVRPLDGLLQISLLHYEAELLSPTAIGETVKVERRPESRKIELARTLIRSWSEKKFDFSNYVDSYHEQLQKLIDAKLSGNKIVTPPDEEPVAVINLMDALKKSLENKPASKRKPVKDVKKNRRRA